MIFVTLSKNDVVLTGLLPQTHLPDTERALASPPCAASGPAGLSNMSGHRVCELAYRRLACNGSVKKKFDPFATSLCLSSYIENTSHSESIHCSHENRKVITWLGSNDVCQKSGRLPSQSSILRPRSRIPSAQRCDESIQCTRRICSTC